MSRENDQVLVTVSRFVVQPLFLLSGTFFPVDQLPTFLHPLAWVSPVWHAADLFRDLNAGDPPLWTSLGHVAYLAASERDEPDELWVGSPAPPYTWDIRPKGPPWHNRRLTTGGKVVAEARSEADEVIIHACDLDACTFGKETIFAFERHRRPEHYGRIVEQTGVVPPPRG